MTIRQLRSNIAVVSLILGLSLPAFAAPITTEQLAKPLGDAFRNLSKQQWFTPWIEAVMPRIMKPAAANVGPAYTVAGGTYFFEIDHQRLAVVAETFNEHPEWTLESLKVPDAQPSDAQSPNPYQNSAVVKLLMESRKKAHTLVMAAHQGVSNFDTLQDEHVAREKLAAADKKAVQVLLRDYEWSPVESARKTFQVQQKALHAAAEAKFIQTLARTLDTLGDGDWLQLDPRSPDQFLLARQLPLRYEEVRPFLNLQVTALEQEGVGPWVRIHGNRLLESVTNVGQRDMALAVQHERGKLKLQAAPGKEAVPQAGQNEYSPILSKKEAYELERRIHTAIERSRNPKSGFLDDLSSALQRFRDDRQPKGRALIEHALAELQLYDAVALARPDWDAPLHDKLMWIVKIHAMTIGNPHDGYLPLAHALGFKTGEESRSRQVFEEFRVVAYIIAAVDIGAITLRFLILHIRHPVWAAIALIIAAVVSIGTGYFMVWYWNWLQHLKHWGEGKAALRAANETIYRHR
jgi:hypothetical protein